ncbi:MAG: helix-turn-helix domain-containing protein [Phycisphaera sp.]|nr:helix-turn-helix domain-containing protein [Phycisphaera sp.]
MPSELMYTGRTNPREQYTAVIGVVVRPDVSLAHYILNRFAELRWRLVDLNAYAQKLPDSVRLDGALLNCLATEPIAQRLLEQNVPMVRLGNFPHPDDPRMPAVVHDWFALGQLAADHFAQRGFKHLGFMGRDPWRDFRPLYEGMNERAAQVGTECHLLLMNDPTDQHRRQSGPGSMDVQKSLFQRWLQTVPRPLGMLATNDHAAHRYCEWAIEVGLSVPEDIAILGVRNQVFTCEGAVVPISSIDVGEIALVDAAINLLSRLIAGQTLDKTTLMIPPKGVVTRRSTDVLAATDPDVVKALRYMWDHVADNLSVDQIVEKMLVSRRKLERAFKRDLGRGIAEEYRRRRMEEACKMLAETDLKIAQIAEALSFHSDHQFFRVFRETFGTTPAKYRKQRTRSLS